MVAVRVRDIWSEIHADENSFQSFDDFIERAFLVNKNQDPSSYDYLVKALQKGNIQNRGAGYTLKLSNSLVNDYINKNGKFAKKKQNPVKMSMLVIRSLLSRMLET